MTSIFSNVRSHVRRTVMTVAAVLAVATGMAQTTVSTTFKVCPLNVDGLPQKILTYDLNSDGPGSDGSKKIGQYIANSGVDVFGLSEDFNYNGSILEGAGSGYTAGTWRGSISLSNEGFLDWTNLRFDTDGLQILAKNDKASFSDESWTAWEQNHGRFTDGADELVTKGYRYYKVNFGQGVIVEFYILHMDAETDDSSNAARASQWVQLRKAIMANNSGLPKIVMGDTNSRYTRDDICSLFIDPITADGNYTVKDVWVEKNKNGVYPTLGSDALMVDELGYDQGEIVDKVLYLNPTHGGMALTPNSITFDADNYKKEDGTLLGDHVPVVVEFKAEGTTYAPAASTDFWVGEKKEDANQQMYLYNVCHKYFITTSSLPTVNNIEQANIWDLNYDSSKNTTTLFYKDSDSKEYRVVMKQTFLQWSAEVKQVNSGATNFTVQSSETTTGAYKFMNGKKYFNLSIEDGVAKYTAANTSSNQNDWLLISEAQKQAYLKYVDLYNEANSLLGERDDLNDELVSVLEETKTATYSTVKDATEKLQSIINKYQSLDVKITDAKYATTCLPWNGEVPEGVTVYIATKYNTDANGSSSLHLEKYNAEVLPKGVGFVLYSTTPGTYTFKRSSKSAATPTGNILSGTYKKIANGDLDFDNHNYMLLGNKDNVVAFYALDATSYIPAFRAYLLLDKTAASKMASFEFDQTDGINRTDVVKDLSVTGYYGVSGEKRARLERGINLVRMSDGSVRKVLVK